MYNLSWKKSSILYKSDKYWTAHLVGGHQVEIQNEENIDYYKIEDELSGKGRKF